MLNLSFSRKLAGGLLFMAALALAPVGVMGSDMPPMAPPVDGDLSDIPASDDKLQVTPTGLLGGLFHHGCGGCSGCSIPSCGGCMAATCGGCASPSRGGGVLTHGAYGDSYVTGATFGYGYVGYGYGGYGFGAPGGYAARIGRPYFYRPTPVAVDYADCSAPQAAVVDVPSPMMAAPVAVQAGGYVYGGGNIETHHFGPGYYRHAEHGHYRFPYYSYRRPWYIPGPASYNRDTNLPW